MHQVSDTANCIYCGRSFDPSRGEGDHIIPAALGEFRHNVHFRGCCPDCNNEIGKCEQQLLQCGPERLLRERVVPSSSRSRGRKVSWVGAYGAPSPKSVIVGDEGSLMVHHTDNPRNVMAPDQLVVCDGTGAKHFIPLFQGMSSEVLKKKIKSLGLKAIKEARLFCDESNHQYYMQNISKAFKASKSMELASAEPGVRTVEVETTFQITGHYFRAYAKIALHYFLANSMRFRGDEPCFGDIREFIMKGRGRDKSKFFTDQLTFQDIYSEFLPSWWVHLLAAKEDDRIAIGYVRLFRGPESRGIAHQIVLGKLPYSNIVLPKTAWAHSYEYDRPVPSKGKVGNVRPVQLISKQIRSRRQA